MDFPRRFFPLPSPRAGPLRRGAACERSIPSTRNAGLFDAGVYRSLRPRGPLDRDEEIEGAAFEGLVAQHLRAWIAYSEGDSKLYFWRTRKGVEVDFVVYGGSGFWAIEVKNTTRVRPQDLRALRAFREDYPEAEALLIYRGTERLRIDGIWCLPGEDFLRGLRPNQGLAPSEPNSTFQGRADPA